MSLLRMIFGVMCTWNCILVLPSGPIVLKYKAWLDHETGSQTSVFIRLDLFVDKELSYFYWPCMINYVDSTSIGLCVMDILCRFYYILVLRPVVRRHITSELHRIIRVGSIITLRTFSVVEIGL